MVTRMANQLLAQVRFAAQMSKKHPGVTENRARFFSRLAAWRVLTAMGRDATVSYDRFGVRFWCPPEWRGMSKLAYTLRDRCEPEMMLLDRWVSKGDVVLDIGAHYGSYTIALAALVGEQGQVVAVEPSPHALEVLRKNIALNGFGNVEVLPVALGEQAGSADLHLHGDPSRASLNQFLNGDAGTEKVTIARLDEVLPATARPVAFIKIDVEGYEVPALLGAARILEHDRPVVQFELQPGAAQRAGLAGYGVWHLLAGHGYRFEQLLADGSYEATTRPEQVRTLNVMGIPK
jgi:FkbM family methyltransferase